MKASGWLLLTGMLIMLETAGCQQQTVEPRIDTSNKQAYIKSLNQVRSQVEAECIEQFDRAIRYAQSRYQLQQQYSLLPASNPLNGLSAKGVLELLPENQKHNPRRLRSWTTI